MLHIKFQASKPNGSEEEDLFQRRCCLKQLLTTHDGHWPMAIAHPEPMS